MAASCGCHVAALVDRRKAGHEKQARGKTEHFVLAFLLTGPILRAARYRLQPGGGPLWQPCRFPRNAKQQIPPGPEGSNGSCDVCAGVGLAGGPTPFMFMTGRPVPT